VGQHATVFGWPSLHEGLQNDDIGCCDIQVRRARNDTMLQ